MDCNISLAEQVQNLSLPRPRDGVFTDASDRKIDWLTLLPIEKSKELSDMERRERIELIDRLERIAMQTFHQMGQFDTNDEGPSTGNRQYSSVQLSGQLVTGLSFKEYIKKNKFWIMVQSICLIGGAVLLWNTPGIIAFGTGNLAARENFYLTLKEILSFSTKFITGYGNPNRSFISKALGTIILSSAIFHYTIQRPICKSYANWRIQQQLIILNNPLIPECYHEDNILNKHTCPISLMPIRFPVYELSEDSEGNPIRIYYEQCLIYGWLESNQISPTTRRRLTTNDLVFDYNLYKQIEERLQQLENSV